MNKQDHITLLQEHAGQTVMRLWQAIWSVIDAHAVQPSNYENRGERKSLSKLVEGNLDLIPKNYTKSYDI